MNILSVDNYLDEKPVVFSGDTYKLYGILREAPQANKIVILAPWVMGDRTGVTRIYVEIAREMQRYHISSLCVDMPPINYSYDPKFNADYYPEFYAKYLETVLLKIKKLYPELEVIIAGYCSSAIPSLYVSRKYNLNRVVTMNPWHFADDYVKRPVHESFVDYIKYHSNKINMLHIISEREDDYLAKLDYVKKYFQDENCTAEVAVIDGANHTFDGWFIKTKVKEKLINWLKDEK